MAEHRVQGWGRGAMADQAPGLTKDEAPDVLPPLPPGRCPRCGVAKEWLRAGEVCAPCKAAPVVGVGVIDQEEDEMAATERCPECGEAFEQNATGRRKTYCSRSCRLKATKLTISRPKREPEQEEPEQEGEAEEGADEGGAEEEAEEGEASYAPDFEALCRFAESIGVDPVEALLTAIAAARGRPLVAEAST